MKGLKFFKQDWNLCAKISFFLILLCVCGRFSTGHHLLSWFPWREQDSRCKQITHNAKFKTAQWSPEKTQSVIFVICGVSIYVHQEWEIYFVHCFIVFQISVVQINDFKQIVVKD